jgi:hypothetical protein
MARKKRTKEPEKPIEVKEVGVLAVEPEIKLRENPECLYCGAKGRGFPKEGFAVINTHSLEYKLEKGEPDGICEECAKFEAKIRATANVKNTKPHFNWKRAEKPK